ncbi:nucleotidyltransferase family protein [Tessaracoccus sp. Y1736]
MGEPPLIPVALRVHLAHAVVQAVADEAGVDILHIKGPAATFDVRGYERHSNDADVIVRPDQVKVFLSALAGNGWTEVIGLMSGGLLEHSANWYHAQLGQLDVHVRFPGIRISSSDAFERLWRERTSEQVAHAACTVPAPTAHRLLLLLHAARNPRTYDSEAQRIWALATAADRENIRALAHQLDAEVALAVSVGGIQQFQDRPEYTFWATSAGLMDAPRGPLRLLARVRAAPRGSRRRLLGVFGYAGHVLRANSSAEGQLGLGKRIRRLTSWLRRWLKPQRRSE